MSKLKPAIIVGGTLGVLLVLTGLITGVTKVGAIGCCNCLWPIAGGLLATFLYIRGSQIPARASDGAVVGLLAGLIGGLIDLVVGLPIQYFMGVAAEVEAQIRQVNNFPLSGVALLIIVGIIGFICYIVLSIIGGLIAVPIFEKRKGGDVPPTAPQGFGGGQPGGGFAA